MLTITNIKKVYKTGSLTQKALDGVTLSLRDSEFVAILGQSGSGKTTLLNIIGGLDRYDEGDLVINGVSTKKYSDRDWDSYRNHTVGFVFQSYNLIPHQTILKNVELALTISGIPSKERTARASEALAKVGLSEHIHKKPSQLSGGQMQRVAIARALVNDPDILLADEPTGALDSDTSIQVMDLLKEVARDRLVVMVTHNPELAEQYATRIVTLKDGRITSDSDPYTPEQGETVHRNLGKASMSFWTSLQLSFNNLWTKKARTILVAFAGSIGIIGIAMILAMSTGANEYIRTVEEESLQSYPLTISDTNFSLLSMYTEMGSGAEKIENQKDVQEWSVVTNLFSGITNNDLESLKTYFESDECTIYDYVQALEYGYNLTPQIYKVEGDSYRQVNPDQAISSLGFSGDGSSMNGLLSSVTSSTDSFFALPREPALYQSNYDLKAGKWPAGYNECVIVLSSSGRISDMALYIMGLKDPEVLDRIMRAFSDGVGIDVDNVPGSYYYDELIGCEFQILSASSYYAYDSEYKVWSNRSTDKKYMMSLLKDAETLRVVGIIQPKPGTATNSMNVGFGYTAELIDHIIGIAAKSEIVKAQLASPEINVFTGRPFDEETGGDELSLASLFTVDEEAIMKAFDFSSADIDLGSLDVGSLDFSGIDLSSVLSSLDFGDLMPTLSAKDIADLLGDVKINLNAADLSKLFKDLVQGYLDYSAGDARADLSALPDSFAQYMSTDAARDSISKTLRKILYHKSVNLITPDTLSVIVGEVAAGYPDYLSGLGLSDDGEYTYFAEYLNSAEGRARLNSAAAKIRNQIRSMLISAEDIASLTTVIIDGYEAYAKENLLPSAAYLLQSFSDYLKSDGTKKLITDAVANIVDTDSLQKAFKKYTDKMEGQMQKAMQKVMNALSAQITEAITKGMTNLAQSMSADLMSAFNFDTAQLSELFKINMSAAELKDLMVSLFSNSKRSVESNLKLLGYADLNKPATITIYPKDFESKNAIKQIISDYNARMESTGQSEKVIQYTDIVDALMGTVTIIIDVISYVLIAFVAISLVVSSIMIGVITYISVLERRKEIGILRAIGASKRNISQVFNAETFIIGALAGLFGIIITELLIIPSNIIIHAASNVEKINAVLPPLSALILILLSIVLTLIGGLIPSRKAAKSDPVTALRAE